MEKLDTCTAVTVSPTIIKCRWPSRKAYGVKMLMLGAWQEAWPTKLTTSRQLIPTRKNCVCYKAILACACWWANRHVCWVHICRTSIHRLSGKGDRKLYNCHLGASKNSGFAQIQDAEKISPRRICFIYKQEIFTQHSTASHWIAVLWQPGGMASSSISWDEMWIFRGSH